MARREEAVDRSHTYDENHGDAGHHGRGRPRRTSRTRAGSGSRQERPRARPGGGERVQCPYTRHVTGRPRRFPACPTAQVALTLRIGLESRGKLAYTVCFGGFHRGLVVALPHIAHGATRLACAPTAPNQWGNPLRLTRARGLRYPITSPSGHVGRVTPCRGRVSGRGYQGLRGRHGIGESPQRPWGARRPIPHGPRDSTPP